MQKLAMWRSQGWNKKVWQTAYCGLSIFELKECIKETGKLLKKSGIAEVVLLKADG